MKSLNEGKANSKYNYTGNRVPYRTNGLNSSSSSGERISSGMGGSVMPGYTSNIPMMGDGGASFPPYQSLGSTPMAMAPHYSMQLPNVPIMYPQSTSFLPSYQMYQSPPQAEGPQVISPAQFSALMKMPGAEVQPQMQHWAQYGGVQRPMGGFPSVPSYSAHSSGNPYIIDYSDGLNILDEPTGGTTYMTK